MRSLTRFGLVGSVLLATSVADAATISGTVTAPDGAPMRAAFVQARQIVALGNPLAESAMESRLRLRIIDSGLPTPMPNRFHGLQTK